MRALPLAGLLLLAACGRTPRDPSQYPIAQSELLRSEAAVEPGAAAYRRTCIGCHGVDGTGQNGRVAANLTDRQGPMTQQDEALLAVIRNGKTGSIGTMPAHGALLSEAEQTAVLAYVRSRFGVAAAPVVLDAGVADGAAPSP